MIHYEAIAGHTLSSPPRLSTSYTIYTITMTFLYLSTSLTVFVEQRFLSEMDKYSSEGVVISSVQIPEFQVYLNVFVEESGILECLDRVANSTKVQTAADAGGFINSSLLRGL